MSELRLYRGVLLSLIGLFIFLTFDGILALIIGVMAGLLLSYITVLLFIIVVVTLTILFKSRKIDFSDPDDFLKKYFKEK